MQRKRLFPKLKQPTRRSHEGLGVRRESCWTWVGQIDSLSHWLARCVIAGLMLVYFALFIVGCSSSSMNPGEKAQQLRAPSPTPLPSFVADTRDDAVPDQQVIVQYAGLPSGVARAIALATDIAYTPPVSREIVFDISPVELEFADFYAGYRPDAGLIVSDKLTNLDGLEVVIQGFIAPPLKAIPDFFVLTRFRLSTCPFCHSADEWPDDIVLVYLPEARFINTDWPVRIRGRLEVGPSVDAETGMVSLVRLYAEQLVFLVAK